MFESGAQRADGAIVGNDNDEDAQRFEAHHDVIRSAEEVQIYEAVMVDGTGRVTTSLLRALRFAKDNRLLPTGFDKARASEDVAVRGDASTDADFVGGGDSVRFDVDAGTPGGPLTVDAELRFQPIGYRWAQNLKQYDAPGATYFRRLLREYRQSVGHGDCNGPRVGELKHRCPGASGRQGPRSGCCRRHRFAAREGLQRSPSDWAGAGVQRSGYFRPARARSAA